MYISAHEQKEEKDRKLAAWIGTILFHAILLLLFLMVSWVEPDPLPEPPALEVVEFDFTGGGGSEGGLAANSASEATESSATEVQDDFATENESEVTVPPKNNATKPVKTDPKPKTEPQPNPNALFGGNNNGNSQTGNSIGSNNGNGNGGTGNGTGNSGNGSGNGPYKGSGLGMNGRTQVASPKPANPNYETGKLYFAIWVNRDGVVTRCQFDQAKSTANDAALIESCKKELIGKQIVNADEHAAVEQKGVYVFEFNVQ